MYLTFIGVGPVWLFNLQNGKRVVGVWTAVYRKESHFYQPCGTL
jgi:hypothetical protein